MAWATDAQHFIVDCHIAVRMHTYRFRHDHFNLLGHHAELAAMATLVAERWFVIEQIEADSEGMFPDTDDAFLDT